MRSGNNISQIKTDDILADVLIHGASKFEIRLFPLAQVGAQPGPGQPFPLNGNPISSCIFEKYGSSTLRIVRYHALQLLSDESFVGDHTNLTRTKYKVTRINGAETTTVTDTVSQYLDQPIVVGPHYTSPVMSSPLYYRDESILVTRGGALVSKTENRYLGHSLGGTPVAQGGIGDSLILSKKFFGTGANDYLLSGTWPNILTTS